MRSWRPDELALLAEFVLQIGFEFVGADAVAMLVDVGIGIVNDAVN